VLDAVEKKLHQASETIEKARVRSRAVGRKLKDVQELPAGEANALMAGGMFEEEDEGDEERMQDA
jgi:DNA recombination protein RmuC